MNTYQQQTSVSPVFDLCIMRTISVGGPPAVMLLLHSFSHRVILEDSPKTVGLGHLWLQSFPLLRPTTMAIFWPEHWDTCWHPTGWHENGKECKRWDERRAKRKDKSNGRRRDSKGILERWAQQTIETQKNKEEEGEKNKCQRKCVYLNVTQGEGRGGRD